MLGVRMVPPKFLSPKDLEEICLWLRLSESTAGLSGDVGASSRHFFIPQSTLVASSVCRMVVDKSRMEGWLSCSS